MKKEWLSSSFFFVFVFGLLVSYSSSSEFIAAIIFFT